jgi:hypothetical protein
MRLWMIAITLCSILTLSTHLRADESYPLIEKFHVGQQWQTEIRTQVSAEREVRVRDKPTTLQQALVGEHALAERVLDVRADGLPTRVARYYDQAGARIAGNNATVSNVLRPERRLVVAQRIRDETVSYSLTGPLTRAELQLVANHIDVLMMYHLLPQRTVKLREKWPVSVGVVQAIAGLEGIVESKVNARLERIRDDLGYILVEGEAQGIAQGSEVKCQFEATALYDFKVERLVQLQWNQKEVRSQGPVSMGSVKLEVVTEVKRINGGSSEQLTPAVVDSIPAEPDAPYLLLRYRDLKSQVEMLHDRAWHLVAQDERMAVLRLLDRGELVAQLNVMPMERLSPGKRMEASTLRRMATDAPGFKLEKLVQEGEVPAKDGKWIYRVSVIGTAGDVRMLENYYVVCGPQGQQVVLIFATELELANRLGGRDLAIVGSTAFPDR